MNIRSNIIKPPKQDIFKSGKFRSIVIQIIVMVLVVGSIGWIVNNAATNMKANGICSWFFFSMGKLLCLILVICHLLTILLPAYTYFNAFVVGLLNTILVAILGIFLATIIGFLIGIGRLSDNWLVSKFCGFYVEATEKYSIYYFNYSFGIMQFYEFYHSAKNSLNIGDSFYLNIKGLFIPKAYT